MSSRTCRCSGRCASRWASPAIRLRICVRRLHHRRLRKSDRARCRLVAGGKRRQLRGCSGRHAAPCSRRVTHQVPQCGYCQSGVIMAVAGLLAQIPNPTDDEIDAGITNICRCGTFARMRAAIHEAADSKGVAS